MNVWYILIIASICIGIAIATLILRSMKKRGKKITINDILIMPFISAFLVTLFNVALVVVIYKDYF